MHCDSLPGASRSGKDWIWRRTPALSYRIMCTNTGVQAQRDTGAAFAIRIVSYATPIAGRLAARPAPGLDKQPDGFRWWPDAHADAQYPHLDGCWDPDRKGARGQPAWTDTSGGDVAHGSTLISALRSTAAPMGVALLSSVVQANSQTDQLSHAAQDSNGALLLQLSGMLAMYTSFLVAPGLACVALGAICLAPGRQLPRRQVLTFLLQR